ncbi:DUF7557 family protein [Halorientalis salina]|uniref:DUF7557 family protein n=1 Tax=Halorientalis salina TaxID=2932266 RepID=UPI0010AC68F9|nr:antitoxin VapB family protein [Halorientalis salina]
MSSTIRVSDDTKDKLRHLKREDETWDELLDRLATDNRSMNPGAWEGTDKAKKAREAVKRSRESFGR